jgi:hypothetical protein
LTGTRRTFSFDSSVFGHRWSAGFIQDLRTASALKALTGGVTFAPKDVLQS